MKKVSIIIRTKNEERWIKSCIDAIYSQDYSNHEIIVVDNKSEDFTLEIVKSYRTIKTMEIENFLPGLALNQGIQGSTGDYIVCLSAHCIPASNDWLSLLVSCLESRSDCAGVYGRQIPVAFTSNIDKRDLLTVFSLESRVQRKDFMFHNANSIIKREVWETNPFCSEATNIEDRIWGQKVIDMGYTIIYNADASVYHYHGLNQNNKSNERLNGIVRILENDLFDNSKDTASQLPDDLIPGLSDVRAFLTLTNEQLTEPVMVSRFVECANEISKSSMIKGIVYASGKDLGIQNSIWIDKSKIENADELSLSELLFKCKKMLIQKTEYPYAFCYVNWQIRRANYSLVDEIVSQGLLKGVDTCFSATLDYSHIWSFNKESNGYRIVENNGELITREKRQPNLKANYGLGLFRLSSSISQIMKSFDENTSHVIITDDKK